MEVDPVQEEESQEAQQPFTRAEWLQQLDETDADIPALLNWTGKALQSLGAGPEKMSPAESAATVAVDGSSGANGGDTIAAKTQAFKESMDQFLAVLRSVDVRLKRQIMGLEEAEIITLKDPAAKGAASSGTTTTAGGPAASSAASIAAGGPTTVSLEPNGIGNIGNLDVGWLNSRSNKVERDMEAEIWAKARMHLERVAGEMDLGSDVKMEP